MATWERDGTGTSTKWLRRVLEDFRTEGTKDMNSTQCLRDYMARLSNDRMKEMYNMDEDAFLEILLNCFVPKVAFGMYERTQERVATREEWIKSNHEAQIRDLTEKHKELSENFDKLHAKNVGLVEENNNMFDDMQRLKNRIMFLQSQLYEAIEAGFTPETICAPDTIEND